MDDGPVTQPTIDLAARQRRLDMQHLQAIEGNPLTAEEIAMFEMFERGGERGAGSCVHQRAH